MEPEEFSAWVRKQVEEAEDARRDVETRRIILRGYGYAQIHPTGVNEIIYAFEAGVLRDAAIKHKSDALTDIAYLAQTLDEARKIAREAL